MTLELICEAGHMHTLTGAKEADTFAALKSPTGVVTCMRGMCDTRVVRFRKR